MEERRENPEIEERTDTLEPEAEESTTPVIEEYNASFDPDPEPELSEDELQDSILEDSNMNSFQKFIAKLDDKKWVLYQRIVGVILGVASCVALFWKGSGDNENAFSWSLIVAIIIAIWVPNILEKRGLRKIPKTRTTMVITMGIGIVLYFVITGLRSGFKFTA